MNGQELRDIGIDRVEQGANPEWAKEAYCAVEALASERHTFTTDDVWERVTTTTPEHRAMGAVMRRAQRDNLIRPTDGFKLTQRASSHRRPLRVWESVMLTSQRV